MSVEMRALTLQNQTRNHSYSFLPPLYTTETFHHLDSAILQILVLTKLGQMTSCYRKSLKFVLNLYANSFYGPATWNLLKGTLKINSNTF